MKRRQAKEINIYSTSAIDIFASGMGVFLILVMIALPALQRSTQKKIDMEVATIEKLMVEVNNLSQVNSQFLQGLTAQTKNLGKVESKIRALAAQATSAKTKEEGVQNVALTLRATQDVVKDLIQSVKVINEQQKDSQKKLKKNLAALASVKRSYAAVEKENTIQSGKIKDLMQKIDEHKQDSGHFVAVLLRWDTPFHDLDLQIIDPDDKRHSVKEGSTTIFSDTRQGPGGEIWYLEKPVAGEYKIKVYFHGKYGNKKAARASLSIIDSKNVQIIPPIQLTKETEITQVAVFSVDDKGQVQLTQK